jgi:hypothetical protein
MPAKHVPSSLLATADEVIKNRAFFAALHMSAHVTGFGRRPAH